MKSDRGTRTEVCEDGRMWKDIESSREKRRKWRTVEVREVKQKHMRCGGKFRDIEGKLRDKEGKEETPREMEGSGGTWREMEGRT